MSRSMFVLRYQNGEPEPLDMGLVRDVLEPYIIEADENLLNGALIRTSDGHEVTLDINEVCLAVNRFPAGQFFTILAELVDRLEASVTPTDLPVVLRNEDDRHHLPADARETAIAIPMTGPALDRFINRS